MEATVKLKPEMLRETDTPALLVCRETVQANIRKAIEIAGGDPSRLRPHVKTCKTAEVCKLMMQAGITKFKCATIAEAEMLALCGARDILLAMQPVGHNVRRLLLMVFRYDKCHFSCLVDSLEAVREINRTFSLAMMSLDVYIDLNTGMNRTGCSAGSAVDLARWIELSFNWLRVAGLHAYDGHIHETDLDLRRQAADASFAILDEAFRQIQPTTPFPLKRVAGGTVTFPIHAKREKVDCSPGTFVFWDEGYSRNYPDLPFDCAAFIAGRVVSVPGHRRACLDIGYKAVASEMPLPRLRFLDGNIGAQLAQSEEHLVVETSQQLSVGDIFFAVPEHICPTVALYDRIRVVSYGDIKEEWQVTARNRSIGL